MKLMDAIADMADFKVCNADDNRDAWLQSRVQFVTASDCAAAIPLSEDHRNVERKKFRHDSYHEYKSRQALIQEKRTGEPDPEADNFWTREGRRAEAFVLQSAVEEWGWDVIPLQTLYRDSLCDALAATPDAVRVTEGGELELVQVKYTKCSPEQWENNLPSYIYHQVQAELGVFAPTGCTRMRVLAYHRFARKGIPLRSYVVPPDPETLAVIRRCASDVMREVNGGCDGDDV